MMCSGGDAASVCPGGAARAIEVPQVEDCLQPVINIVPLQVKHSGAASFFVLLSISFLVLS